MSTKTIFHCGGGSNLILGTGMENHIFILRTPATINFFNQILKKLHFGVRKKTNITHPDAFVYLIYGRPHDSMGEL